MGKEVVGEVCRRKQPLLRLLGYLTAGTDLLERGLGINRGEAMDSAPSYGIPAGFEPDFADDFMDPTGIPGFCGD
ncbi:hypothetical protein KFK09_011158 [Dendrobium nobile]|uniref:Uncharacterized protein n=1 Tax=Dendrobium nobile TaxID=94219 RepID=A0A8T3BDS4_DENNO|nr:hypothetical protein KFK09_011158 [Dendrobium nobile]